MTNQQIELVEQTFQQVKPIAAEAARIFYERLFELDPSLRPMFRGDMEGQGTKLMQTIGVAVASLRRLDQILPALTEMGRHHAQYGVRDEHYATVAAALLDTLALGLGEAFTPQVREAWTIMYMTVATAMQNGARLAAEAAA